MHEYMDTMWELAAAGSDMEFPAAESAILGNWVESATGPKWTLRRAKR